MGELLMIYAAIGVVVSVVVYWVFADEWSNSEKPLYCLASFFFWPFLLIVMVAIIPKELYKHLTTKRRKYEEDVSKKKEK